MDNKKNKSVTSTMEVSPIQSQSQASTSCAGIESETELVFPHEDNESPSPQPQPDLLIDLSSLHESDNNSTTTPIPIIPVPLAFESFQTETEIHFDDPTTNDTEFSPVEFMSLTMPNENDYDNDNDNMHLITTTTTTGEPEEILHDGTNQGKVVTSSSIETKQSSTTSSSTTKTVKKKKSSTRTESISVAPVDSSLPDVFSGVNVLRARRSFGDLSTNNVGETNVDSSDESENESLLKSKRSKSCSDGIQKSSLSKFDMLQQQEQGKRSLKKSETEQQESQGVEPTTSPTELKKICKACGTQVFAMECLKAEKADWHKSCFRCEVCKKLLSVEAYSSHEGRLFCKPHFRELFQPKAVVEDPDAHSIVDKLRKVVDKTEIIIRESQPAPLPEGVVRASDPIETGLEDLQLDVKSKFELFENLKNQEERSTAPKEQIEVKKSASVSATLAKYQAKVGMGDIGVPDEALAGGIGPRDNESSDEEIEHVRKPHILDEINTEAIDSVRNKWASGINSRAELVQEHRKEEQSRFRNRLLLGKNNQLKEMYEKAVVAESSGEKEKPLSPNSDIVKSEKAKQFKEMFEKGDFAHAENVNGSKSPESKLEGEVFDSAIAKQSRELFKELDKGGALPPKSNSGANNRPKRLLDRTESTSEVVRSSDVIEEIVKPADLGSKFKFFEDGGALEKKPERKQFRITPPRDDKEPSPDVEIYRDPNIVRSSDSAEPAIPVTRTASKMLSVFRKLEQEQDQRGTNNKVASRPLKEFTPPREPLKIQHSSEEEGEESEEDDEVDYLPEKEEVLKQVGNLARASSLRAKFERWEADENERNVAFEKDSPSIESTKDLRAKFENLKREEEERKMKRPEVKVNRFVELQISGTTMETCCECSKRVYVMEKTEAGGKIYHKNCFRCSHCKCQLRMDTFTSNKGTLYCTPHFKQLFKIKGNYDEGFGHETQRQQWEKSKKAKTEQVEDKEN